LNNAKVPQVFIKVLDRAALEKNADTATFRVTRTGDTTECLAVEYVISGSATNRVNYVYLNGVVIIPAGSTERTITVTAVDDAEVEGVETVTVTLTETSACELGTSVTAMAVIKDNDTNSGNVILGGDINGDCMENTVDFAKSGVKGLNGYK